jgi:hypothetical protein
MKREALAIADPSVPQPTCIAELNTPTGVGQYLGYGTLEFQGSFLGHVMFLLHYQHDFARVEQGHAPAGVCRV